MQEIKVQVRLGDKRETLYQGFGRGFAEMIYRAAIRSVHCNNVWHGGIVSYTEDGLEVKCYVPIDCPREKLVIQIGEI